MAQPSRVEAYAHAFFQIAQAERRVESVEDDLFRFSRAFDANDELRMALSDRTVPAERRVAVIEELMGRTALPTSVGLVAMVVGADRAGNLPAIVERFLELSAAQRQREVAEVRAAVPLDDRLRERLARALSEALGKEVEVKAVWEPNNYTKITRKRKVTVKTGENEVDLRKSSDTEKDDIVVSFVPTPQARTRTPRGARTTRAARPPPWGQQPSSDPGRTQKISGQNGGRSVRNSALARANAPSVSSTARRSRN